MRLPDEQRPKHVKLPNGEQHAIDELLKQAYRQYTETKKTWNLSRRTKLNQPRQVAGPKVQSKYSAEDAIWMQDKTAQEIAKKYNITVHQSYYVKNYVKRLFG